MKLDELINQKPVTNQEDRAQNSKKIKNKRPL